MRDVRTWLALCLAGSACGPQENRWEGRHITARAPLETQLCPNTLDFWDSFIEETHRIWYGEAPATDLSLLITLAPEAAGEDTGLAGSANSSKGVAWARDQNAALHEIAHLVIGSKDGTTVPSLREGLATALAPSNRGQLWFETPTDPEAFFFLPDATADHYLGSAQLMRPLVEQYGWARIREAHLHAKGAKTENEIEARMLEIFDDDALYDTFDDFAETYPLATLQAWECSGALVPEAQLPIEIDQIHGCDADGVLGATSELDDAWFPFLIYTLDIGLDDGPLTVDVTDNASIYIERCLEPFEDATIDDVSSFSVGALQTKGVHTWTPVPGRYLVEIRAARLSEAYSAHIHSVN